MPSPVLMTRVVIVFGQDQIFRSSLIRRDQGSADNRCRVIPTTNCREFQLAESAVEVEQPAAVVVAGKRILELHRNTHRIWATWVWRCFRRGFGVESSGGVSKTYFGQRSGKVWL